MPAVAKPNLANNAGRLALPEGSQYERTISHSPKVYITWLTRSF